MKRHSGRLSELIRILFINHYKDNEGSTCLTKKKRRQSAKKSVMVEEVLQKFILRIRIETYNVT